MVGVDAAREARDAKLDALHEQLTAAVEQLVTSADWVRAMEFAAHFRSRSFKNTLLILIQHFEAYEAGRVPEPTPTYVAGFRQWQRLGRQVIKGQSGYSIFAPVTARFASSSPADPKSWRRLARRERPRPGEALRTRMVGVRPAHVWDISQTSGPAIADIPQPELLTGRAPEGLWDGLAKIVVERGFTLHDAPDAAAIDGANGLTHWINRTVHVRRDMDDSARARTLGHEVGHIVLHDRNNVDAVFHRGIAEVEAESVASMIGAAHGMDTSVYTIPYVAGWASSESGMSPVELVQRTGERARAAAIKILDALPTSQTGIGDPPGVDRPARASAVVGSSVGPAVGVEDGPTAASRSESARVWSLS
jgi:hypothetical protein